MAFQPMYFTVLMVLTGHRGADLRNHAWCFRVNGAGNPSQAELASLNTEWWTRIGNQLRALSCNDLVWETITSRFMGVPNGAESTYTFPSPQPGSAAGFSLPGNSAYALSWRTGTGGKSFRGRTYVANLSEGAVTGDTVVPAFLASAANLAAVAIGNYVSNRFSFAVGSRKLGGSTAITGFVLDPIVDSQRRRLAGRGR